MNKHEWKSWLDEHETCFPSLKRFFADKDADERVEMLIRWRKALEDVEYDDAMQVTIAMVRKEIEPPSEWGMEQLPGIIRSNAQRLKAARDRDDRREQLLGPVRGPRPDYSSEKPLAEIYRELMDRKARLRAEGHVGEAEGTPFDPTAMR